jgi:hypothetical protein
VNALRRSRLTALISIFALVGQLFFSIAHAQAWARQGGDPLLYAYCGTSPALIARLRAVAPPELLKQLAQDRGQIEKLSCELCVSVHGSPLAASTHVLTYGRTNNAQALAAEPRASAPTVRLTRLHQARAPPFSSV